MQLRVKFQRIIRIYLSLITRKNCRLIFGAFKDPLRSDFHFVLFRSHKSFKSLILEHHKRSLVTDFNLNLLFLIIFLEHRHDINKIRVERPCYLSLLNFIINHQLSSIPFGYQTELLIWDQIFNINVSCFAKRALELAFD